MAYTQKFESGEGGGTSWWEDEAGTRVNWTGSDQSDMGVGGGSWSSFSGDPSIAQRNPFTQQMAEWEAGLAAAPRFGSDTKILSEPSQQSPWYTLDVGGTTKYVLPYRAMRQASDTGLMSDNPYVWAAPGGQWGAKLGWGSKSGYHKPEIYNLEGFLGPAYESAKVFSDLPKAVKWTSEPEEGLFESMSGGLSIIAPFFAAALPGIIAAGGAGAASAAGGAGTPAWWDFGAGAAGGAVEAGGTLATGALEQGLASGAIT